MGSARVISSLATRLRPEEGLVLRPGYVPRLAGAARGVGSSGASRDASSAASAMTRPAISRGWSNGASSYFCHPSFFEQVRPFRQVRRGHPGERRPCPRRALNPSLFTSISSNRSRRSSTRPGSACRPCWRRTARTCRRRRPSGSTSRPSGFAWPSGSSPASSLGEGVVGRANLLESCKTFLAQGNPGRPSGPRRPARG